MIVAFVNHLLALAAGAAAGVSTLWAIQTQSALYAGFAGAFVMLAVSNLVAASMIILKARAT